MLRALRALDATFIESQSFSGASVSRPLLRSAGLRMLQPLGLIVLDFIKAERLTFPIKYAS
jgi:hypothetical protein